MQPYYEQDGITIYHGDCLAVMESFDLHWGDRRFDLLLTDPPYGIQVARTGRVASGNRTACRTGFCVVLNATDFGVTTWDDHIMPEAVAQARQLCTWQMVFGGNYYDLPPARGWLVWDKDNAGTMFADCELVWTNLDQAVRKLTYRWNGMLQQPGRPKEIREHPTQKPEPVVVWALTQAPATVRTVFDPFMGTGTTLVAAKRLGKQAVGIEREERYCEIAARRLAQGALVLA